MRVRWAIFQRCPSTLSAPPASIPFRTALRYWLKLGFISFGGPAGQIAMMHAELVERRRWISERRFLHALNYCMVLPGPEATQLAIYIGWLMHRVPGGIAAGVLFVLPSLLVLIALSWIYMAWGQLPAVAGIMAGIKPAVVAIVLAAAWRIGSRTLRNGVLVSVALAAFVGIDLLGVPFPLIVLGAAAVGLVGGRLRPALFDIGGAHAAAKDGTPHPPAVIDDTTPTPAHARFGWRRLATVGAAGCAIGFAAWGVLAFVYGPDGELPRMAAFFGKTALLTFGGAYAVLPYVVQHAVEQYHWLDAGQMIDGLALGETTPGPLIMIVAFVGFVGGWTHALFGPGARFLAGAAAASVVTFFTFLPSFVFILAGGPLVESTRDDVRLTAPLTAISAAVVGVIASLAVFFGAHVFVAHGAPRWDAIAIGAAAAVALLRYRTGTIKTILACALAGLLLSYWHG
ncbi:chromate efflux transporter [Massilia pinisoli]|uniref:Chromate efflux transporter n=1 Tax=Massilia pinisoli TaxID=1772194 RepID=A0ABT1ZMZ7_9BURK|nr:chromate efflux transporter [Massilia pinisoli]MCS0581265.1 chromate efflux transporter [Massilia pinisoli]